MSDSVESPTTTPPLVDFHADLYRKPFIKGTLGPLLRENLSGELKRISLRRADASDAQLIANIAAEVNIHKYSQDQKGFLVYSLTAPEYAKRILDGHYVFIFECEGRPIGFSCSYNEEGLDCYHKDKTLSHESSICRAVMEAAESAGYSAYIFIDQVAVLPSFQNRGWGGKYFDLFCQQFQGPFYGAILEAPVRNPRMDFWQKCGFTRLCQVEETLPKRFRQYKTQSFQETFLWGIYMKDDSNYFPQR